MLVPLVAFQSQPKSLTGFVVLLYFLYPLLFDEISDCSAIHRLHQVGLEVVEGEPEVEIVLWVPAHVIQELIGFAFNELLYESIHFVLLVFVDAVGLMLFGQT